MSRAGLRKRFEGYFVRVPRKTIRDRRLDFKARGILAYLLDMPDGYDPSIEKLSAASDGDGTSAVASGVLLLRQYGYYRVERRRLLNGTFVMGSAVSETPVEEWAEDHRLYGGKVVPLVEQPDGSFKVIRPDGSLVDDGFETPSDDPDESPREGTAGASPQVTPEPGFPGPVSPAPDEPAPASPEPENPAPKGELQTGDKELPEDSLRSSSAATSDDALFRDDRPAPPPAEEPRTKATDEDLASRAPLHESLIGSATAQIVTRFIGWFKTEGEDDRILDEGSVVMALREQYVKKALKSNYTPVEVRRALAQASLGPDGKPQDVLPTKTTWRRALKAAAGGKDLREVQQRRRPGGTNRTVMSTDEDLRELSEQVFG